MFEPRPYQTAVVEAVRDCYRQQKKAVILQLPTGAGKTACAGIISRGIASKLAEQRHCLYLVHRKELVRQVQATLEEFGLSEHTGYLVPWLGATPWRSFQVGSIQTVSRRLSKLDWLNPRIIIIDEAHHARAKSWEKVISHWENVQLLGLTATPARLDGKGLGAFFDQIVSGPSVAQLIEQGFLCDFDLYSTPVDINLDGVKRTGGDYNKGDLDTRTTSTVIASAVKNWKRLASNRRTIHYAVTRRHSRHFVEQMKKEGFSAEHVDGETPSKERETIFRRFSTGKLQVVSNVELITEGFDCPECDCVILGRPTQSLTLYLQMVGRMMRPKIDGHRGMILDLCGNVGRHGDPRHKYSWSLEDGAEAEREREVANKTRVCSNCSFCYPKVQESCPICGFTPATRIVEEVDVALELASPDAQPSTPPRPSRKALSRMVLQTGGDMKALKEIQKTYGYKPSVVYQWHRIFGEHWLKR